MCVCADAEGNLAAVIPVKVGVKRGITIRAETDSDAEVITYCQQFHDHYKPTCVYNMQLMKTAEGRIYPFELNPRISTTFALAIATGFDPVATYFNGMKGTLFTTNKKMSLHRHWMNHITELQA